jgi:uncharacterized protein YndB with AHSA1/START domain
MTKTKNQTKITAEPSKQELFIIREFEAPRELVFKAFTDPELIARWLGPRELTCRVDAYENKEGGYWRFINTDANGNEFGFHGVTHEITKPERLIRTFEFEGLPERGHVSLETAMFEALPDNRTKLTIQSVFRSVMDRDGIMQSGMERGVNDSHARLDELFENEKIVG